jgi:hypothetical protein
MLAFLGFFLLGASWSVALPYDGPPDELQHVVKAYAVGGGELLAPKSNRFTVPVSLVPPGTGCFRWRLQRAANCQTTPGTGGAVTDRTTSSMSGAGTANPAYYLLVGPIIHAWPDFAGIIVARLLTAAVVSAVLAASMALLAGLSTRRWLLPGMLAACTPVAISLEGAVNAAGVEIATGIGLWVALVALVDAEEASPAAAWLAGVCAGLMGVLRGFGVGWLALIVVVAGLGLSRRRIAFLYRFRALRISTGVALVLACYGWVWTWSVSAPIPDRPIPTPLNPSVMEVFHLWAGVSTPDMYLFQLWTRVPYYLQGMVGLMSYGDVPLPEGLFLLWFSAVGLLVFGAVVFCTWRTRLRIAGMVLVGLGILVSGDVAALRVGFYLSQGRYALVFLVGAPLLAGYALGRQAILGDRQLGQLTRTYAVVLLPMQMVALWVTMLRFEHGVPRRFPIGAVDPLIGAWLPPYGPVLPLVLCALGLLVVGGLFWRLAATPPVIMHASTRSGRTHPPAAGPAVALPGGSAAGHQSVAGHQSHSLPATGARPSRTDERRQRSTR